MTNPIAGRTNPTAARTNPTAARSFPFPFRADTFRYSTNVEPARVAVATEAGEWGRHVLHCDHDYEADLALRSRILDTEPPRYVLSPSMRAAGWDAMLVVLTELARSHPDEMHLVRQGDSWLWRNDRLGLQQQFTIGREDTLDCPPLVFAGSQTQDDLVLLDQRDGELRAEGGLVTFAADWSMAFVLGMSFLDLHAPVPEILHRENVIRRAHTLLLDLAVGADLRRTNWLMTVGRHLDLSTEQTPAWAPDRSKVLESDLGQTLQLRVELQHLLRLPSSGAILFTIRTYHLSMDELAAIPGWRRRFLAVLTELPDELIAAKGMTDYHSALVAWLAAADRDDIQLKAST